MDNKKVTDRSVKYKLMAQPSCRNVLTHNGLAQGGARLLAPQATVRSS